MSRRGDSKHSGFTLVEMAVVLLMASLMTGFMLQVIDTGKAVDCYVQTRHQVRDINKAIEKFTYANSRLPMPARLDFGSNNPAFGVEASTGNMSVTATGDNVLIGMLPHATLGLGNGYAADCWGNKFVYAVTEKLTTSNAATGYTSSSPGVITLNTNALNAPTTVSAAVSYVVISPGMNGVGATGLTANNSSINSCSLAATDPVERENCDHTNSIFTTAAFNNGATAADYFDDVIVYGQKPPISYGSLYCWGTDSLGHGILADDSSVIGHFAYTPRSAASREVFTDFPVNVSPANASPCALTNDGTAYCWGYNGQGAVGDGTTDNRAKPTEVSTAQKFTQLYQFGGGAQITNCGLTSDGTAYCWGYNGNGLLGIGADLTYRNTPTPVDTTIKFARLSSGGTGTPAICGIQAYSGTDGGLAYCWGNHYAEIGAGQYLSSYTYKPTPVVGGHKFTQIYGFSPTCALTGTTDALGTGKIFCWGGAENSIGLVAGRFGNLASSITGITNASPARVSVPAVALYPGSKIVFGTTNAKLAYREAYITNLTATTFDLAANAALSVPVDSSGWGSIGAISDAFVTEIATGPVLVPNTDTLNRPLIWKGLAPRSEEGTISAWADMPSLSASNALFSWGDNEFFGLGSGLTNSSSSLSITSASKTNPVVITRTGHGLATGDWIWIDISPLGMHQLRNRLYRVTYVSATQFSLQDREGNNVNGTGYSNYTGAGKFFKLPNLTDPNPAFGLANCLALKQNGAFRCQYNPVKVAANAPGLPGRVQTGAKVSAFSTNGNIVFVWGAGDKDPLAVGDGSSDVYRTNPQAAFEGTLIFRVGHSTLCTVNPGHPFVDNCWSSNKYGQLGLGHTTREYGFFPINSSVRFSSMMGVGSLDNDATGVCAIKR